MQVSSPEEHGSFLLLSESGPGMVSIGLDAHSASFTMAAMKENGEVVRCLRRPTSAQNLIEMIGEVPGRKHLVVEEGPMAPRSQHFS